MDFSIEKMPLSTRNLSFDQLGKSCQYNVRTWAVAQDVSKALIVLDDELIGDTFFTAAKALIAANEIEPFAIYSIGFDVDSFGDLHQKRAKFLTMQPVDLRAIGVKETGRGNDLLSFIKQTVVPSLFDSHPNLSEAPILAGYSLSGLFAMLAAHEEPSLFADIIAISPSLFIDRDILDKCTELLRSNEHMRLFLAAGALENDRMLTALDQHMHELVGQLGADLSLEFGSRISTTILESQTHASSQFAAVPMALKHLVGKNSDV